MASSQTPERFAHVANLMLRRILESPPDQVKQAQMQQALRRTPSALLRDEITDDPALFRALPARRTAAQTAYRALASNRPTRCHRALRRFWSI